MTKYVTCPHCENLIEIAAINCGIFRHGVFKNNYQQLNPHAPKSICDDVFEKGLIYGCGKPFKVEISDNQLVVTKCEYI